MSKCKKKRGKLGWLVLLLALPAAAETFTFTNVCEGLSWKRIRGDLQLFCPQEEKPWLILKGCARPQFQMGPGSLTINCT